MTSARHRPENTADGCRALARDDLARAAAITNPHMRSCLERSADAWTARAKLLDRIDASFKARAEAVVGRSEQSRSPHQ